MKRRAHSLVEFALVLPVFFLLMFGILDFGRLFFTKVTLENAVRQAGRFAVTGNHLTDPSTGSLMTRVDSIIEVARRAAAGLNITDIEISSVEGGSTGPGRAGGPGDTITIQLTTDLHLITPMIGRYFGSGGVYTFTVSTVFRNERFPVSQTN